MLKQIQNKSEFKSSLVLMVYGALLSETLTSITLAAIVAGSLLVWFGKRPSRLVRNIVSLGIFGSFWLIYGKVIDPEVGLNFLTLIIVLKILEKESERDRYMIFFGLLLLLSAGTLFEKSALYIFFFASSFLILIQDFYGHQKLSFKLADFTKLLLWILPISVLLFFFAPRMMNPLPMNAPKPEAGEIGYTPEVNISQVESLSTNNKPVFEAQLSRRLPPDELYWRGNTLSFSDGWNWPIMASDRLSAAVTSLPSNHSDPVGIVQNVRLLSKQDFLFTLDHPLLLKARSGHIPLSDTKSVSLSTYLWIPRYVAIGQISSTFASLGPIEASYKRNWLSLAESNWVKSNFSATDAAGVIREARNYFTKEGFTYSLAPGKIPDFKTFMQDKKVGFCSHYASALALILRAKGIPSRLVSGFLGGNYNQYADFYLVGQNDAHVWVEVYADGNWMRVDPTGWIVPTRIQLSGEAFMSQLEESRTGNKSFRLAWVADAQKWIAQWDFKIYQWLEDMDYWEQEALFEKLNLERKWLFSLIPLMLASFMAIYAFNLSRRQRTDEASLLWTLLKKRLGQRGIEVELHSVRGAQLAVLKKAVKDQDQILKLVDDLTQYTFGSTGDGRELLRRIKRI
jgi:protein-glutamine gamma-glutamyltransferase